MAAKNHRWIIFPLGAMVIVCMSLVVLKPYALTNLLAPSLHDAFWFPPFPALLVALFGIMYIYKTLQKKFISNTARVIAYLLLAVFATFIIIISVALISNARILYAVFGNPYTLGIISGLALAGGGALLAAPGTSHTHKK